MMPKLRIAMVALIGAFALPLPAPAEPPTASAEHVEFSEPLSLPEFTFSYPSNWTVVKAAANLDKYWQALILGPRHAESHFPLMFIVRRMPVAAPKNLESLLAERERQRQATRAENIVQSSLPVAGLNATRTDYTAMRSLPADSPNPKPTEVHVSEVAFEIGHVVFEVTLQSDARDAAAGGSVFDQFLASLKRTPQAP